jgi:hypothetical protein
MFQCSLRDFEADGKQGPFRSPENTHPYPESVHRRWPPERIQAKGGSGEGGYIDRYGHGLFLWVLLFFVLNIFDCVFTRIILDGGGHEVNPFIHWLIATCGDHFISWKLAIISGSIIILCLHSKHRIVKPVFYFSTVIYSVVVIYQMILISGL